MFDSIKATSSTLGALRQQYRCITNNLSNANVSGYKRRLTTFSMSSKGGGGTVNGKNAIDFTQGHMTQTGRPLDLALIGKGFFMIQSPEGDLYTRNGSFRVNDNGQIVDYSDRIVAGQNGPITVPKTASTQAVNISTDGKVSVNGRPLGKLKIVEFEKVSELKPVSGNLFKASGKAGAKEAQNTDVRQGFQEASNVSTVEELVDLIQVTRTYEANMKTINTDDERMKNLMQVAMS